MFLEVEVNVIWRGIEVKGGGYDDDEGHFATCSSTFISGFLLFLILSLVLH